MEYNGIEIRTKKIGGKTLVVAADMCKVLDDLVVNALYKIKPAHTCKEKMATKVSGLGIVRMLSVHMVDSAGAKYVIDRSGNPEKESFKAWLAENIFPTNKLPKKVEAELVEVDKELDKTLPVAVADVQPFFFDGSQVRATVINDEPWFVARDVCDVLGISSTTTSLRKLPEIHKGVQRMHTHGGPQTLSIVSEPGLYRLVFRSDKPQAEPFMEWITAEVIPAIRKTGTYSVTNSNFYVPSTHAEALRLAADLSERNFELVAKIEADAHKVLFADHVAASDTSISVRRFAKILHDKDGLDVGEHRLFDWLRKAGYLMFDNTPYQRHITAGYFEVVEKVHIRASGAKIPYTQTLITGKGQIAISDHILSTYPETTRIPRKRVTREMLAHNTVAA